MMGSDVWPVLMRSLNHSDRFVRNGAAEVFQNLGVLDSLIVMEAATDNPGAMKIDMLRRIAAAGGVRFTDSLGLSEVNVAVSAAKAAAAGLWVGGATVGSRAEGRQSSTMGSRDGMPYLASS